MADQKAVGRIVFWAAWTLQVAIWAIGATALFLARAIDIGEARYPVHFTYTTPLYLNDVLEMIALARPIDFLVPTTGNFFLWFYVLFALVLILDRKRRIGTLWRTVLLVPQACLFGVFVFHGLSSLITDLPQLWSTRLDGEWLGEGWNHFEAGVFWLPTLLILLFQPLLARVGRLLWRAWRVMDAPPASGVPFSP